MFRHVVCHAKIAVYLALTAVMLGVLAGCASRPDSGALIASHAPSYGGTEHTVMVVTTRERDDRPATYFNGERGDGVDFAKVTISVPPNHTSGKIEWPDTLPGNPETSFVTRSASYIDGEAAFTREMNAQLAARGAEDQSALLFIHGYNTLFAEGLYRFTQVAHDAKIKGVPVLFTWASRGSTPEYVYDLNSAAVARDALEKALLNLASSDVREIYVLAHSMGNWLLMETFRQMSPAVKDKLRTKVKQVVLAAPDIDIDVFKQQLKKTGKPKNPFIIIVSKDDRALRLSRTIAGGKERVGQYSDDQELADLGAIVVDLTELEAQDGAHHSKFAQIAEFGPELRQVLSQQDLTSVAPESSTEFHTAGNSLGSVVTTTAHLAITLPVAVIKAPLTLATGGQ